MMGPVYFSKLKLKGKDIFKRGAKEQGYVRINQTGGDMVEMKFDKKNIIHNFKVPPTNVLAYGSTRLFSSGKIKPEASHGRIKAKNMFFPDSALFSDELLRRLAVKNKKQFDFACRALKDLLIKELDDGGVSFSIIKKEVWVHYSDKERSSDKLRELSDGYKSVIALACDMMQSLLKDQSTMETAEGIVLIDEIGTHLHPRWKMRVVKSFRNAFPRLQFIATTHDPLCLKGLGHGEVAVFDKEENGKVFSITNLPDPAELKAEQLLSSKFFGLLSTLDEDLEKDFDEYYGLLSKGNSLNPKEKERRDELRSILKNKSHLGDTLREELALTAADQILASELKNPSNKPVEELQSSTLQLLKELWDKPLDQPEKVNS